MFLFLLSIAASIKICICESLDCRGADGCNVSHNIFDPLNKQTSRTFYENLAKLIFQETNVELLVVGQKGIYEPEINLLSFYRKNLKISILSPDYAPKTVKLLYEHLTDINEFPIDVGCPVTFKYTKGGSIEQLDLTKLELSTYGFVRFDPQPKKNSISIKAQSAFIPGFMDFDTVTLNNNSVTLECSKEYAESYKINMQQDKIVITTPGDDTPTTFTWKTKPVIKFLDVSPLNTNVEIVMETAVTDVNLLPSFSVYEFNLITFNGSWSGNKDSKLPLLSLGEEGYSLNITIDSDVFPFDVDLRVRSNLIFNIKKSCNFIGKIQTKEDTVYEHYTLLSAPTSKKSTVSFKQISGWLYLLGNLEVTVEEMIFNSGKYIPIRPHISDKAISTATIKKLTHEEIISYEPNQILIQCDLTGRLNEIQVRELFKQALKGTGYVIQMPLNSIKKDPLAVKFTNGDGPPGFINEDNMLGIDISDSTYTKLAFDFIRPFVDDELTYYICSPTCPPEIKGDKKETSSLELNDIINDPNEHRYRFIFYSPEKASTTYTVTWTSQPKDLEKYHVRFFGMRNTAEISLNLGTGKVGSVWLENFKLGNDITVLSNEFNASLIVANAHKIKVNASTIETDCPTYSIVERTTAPTLFNLLLAPASASSGIYMTVNDSSILVQGQFDQNITLETSLKYEFKVYSSLALIGNISDPKTFNGMKIHTYGRPVRVSRFNYESLKEKMTLDHGEHELIATYYANQNQKLFTYVGNGPLSAKIDYGGKFSFCLYRDDQHLDEDCGRLGMNNCSYSNLNVCINNKLTLKEKDSQAKIYLRNSNKDTHPVFPLELISKAYFSFLNIDDDSYIEFDNTNTGIDMDSSFVFISRKTNIMFTSPNNPVSFGTFWRSALTEVNFIGASNIDFNCVSLSCPIDDLEKFKSVNVKESLTIMENNKVYQQTATASVTLSDGCQLTLRIPTETTQTITYSANKLVYGQYTFNMNHQDSVLMNIEINPKTSLKFDFDKSTELSSIPKSKLVCKGTEYRKIEFTENWGTSTSPLLFIDVLFANITLGSKLPALVTILNSSETHYINFIASMKEVGIQHGFVWDAASVSQILTIDSLISAQTIFAIGKKLLTQKSSLNYGIKLLNPFIEFTVTDMDVEIPDDYTKFDLELAMTDKSIAKMIIDDFNINRFESIQIKANINVVNAQQVFLIGKSETYLSIATTNQNLTELLKSGSITYQNLAEIQTFGFGTTINVIDFGITGNTLTLSALKELESLKYVLKYGDEFVEDVSVLIKSETDIMTKLNEVPGGISNIVLYIVKDVSTPIKLADFEHTNTHLTIDGHVLQRHQAPIVLGGNFKQLTINNINIIQSPKSNTLKAGYTIDFMELNDVSFLDSTFKFNNNIKLLHIDGDSLADALSHFAFDKFTNPILVTSANIITYTKEGWNILEFYGKTTAVVKQSLMPASQLTFLGNSPVTLLVEDTLTMTEIIPANLTILSEPNEDVKVSMGLGWNHIENAEKIRVYSDGKPLTVYSSSYPVPNIFVSEASILTDTSNGIDLSFPSLYTLSTSMNFDMTKIEKSLQILNANTLICEGNSSLVFTDNIGTLKADTILVKHNAKTALPNVQVKDLEMDQDSALFSHMIISNDLVINMHWKLNYFPYLSLLTNVDKAPKSLTLIFNESSIDEVQYNSLLFGKVFEIITGEFPCSDWIKVAHFKSTLDIFGDNKEASALSFKCSQTKEGKRSLVMEVTKALVDSDSSQSGSGSGKISGGVTAGITIAIAAVVGIVIGLVVWTCTRKKYEALLNSEPLEFTDVKSHTESSVDAL